MKKYKFKDLDNNAQHNAIKNYLDGWSETHSDYDLEYNEVKTILLDNNDDDMYDAHGNYIGDEYE